MKTLSTIFAALVACSVYSADVVEVKIRALDGFGGDSSMIASRCQTKAGSEYDALTVTRDVAALKDSGEFEEINADAKRVEGGVEVTFFVRRKLRFVAPLVVKGCSALSESKIAKESGLKDGYLYGRVQGTLLNRGTVDEIAAEVKAKLEAKRKQAEIMKQADAASGVERARLIAQACEFKGIERPNNAVDMVRAADPSDSSGMVKRLTFDPWAFAQKYCGKKSDGGLELPADETVRIMQDHLKDPAYTNEQKQVFHAVIIGTLRREKGAAAATQLRNNIMEMKRLDPNSNLGVTADQTIKIWLNNSDKKK